MRWGKHDNYDLESGDPDFDYDYDYDPVRADLDSTRLIKSDRVYRA